MESMLVYWDRKQRLFTADVLAGLGSGCDPVDMLIRVGQLEAGVADTCWPEADGDDDTSRALRQMSIGVARAYLDHASLPEPPRRLAIPDVVEAGIPEGYAYYGLFPETYAEAARRFRREQRPASVVVIGIRNIGTSLSAVVAAALEREGVAVASWTVRPRGHPFDRRLALTPELHRTWKLHARDWFAIVDEGPGLSGSSMTGVAATVGALGVPEGRIVFFPSWEPDGTGFVSDRARELWRRHAKYTGHFRAPEGLEDISAGAWRRWVYASEAEWPAVQPQHEARKYLEDGRVLWKFAGLGEFGRRKLERAWRLFEAGFGPRPLGFENGFLRVEWTRGRPVRRMSRELLEKMARYLSFLRDEFRGGESADLSEFGLPGLQVCAIDGRMLPHEWIETRRGFLKTDALDHHDNHFVPGCQNIAWDVAGAAVEFDLDDTTAAELAARCGVAAEHLWVYRAAYRAFRQGYCTLAETALAGTPDGARFSEAIRRYR